MKEFTAVRRVELRQAMRPSQLSRALSAVEAREVEHRVGQGVYGSDAVIRAWAALKVIATTPQIRAFLTVQDPKALEQVDEALA